MIFKCYTLGNLKRGDLMNCNHTFVFTPNCGSHVCVRCELHAHVTPDSEITQELARCWCGWSVDGRNGYMDLVELDPTLDEYYLP